MRRATKVKLKQVGFVFLFWVFITVFKILYDNLFMKVLNNQAYTYDLMSDIYTSLLAAVLAGILGGFTIVFFLKDSYKHYPWGLTILINTFTICIIIFIVAVPVSIFYNSTISGHSFWHPQVIDASIDFFFRADFILVVLVWVTVSVLTLIFLQVNDRYGHGVLLNMLRGRYYSPKQEDRIFMFLDMKSSTSIAEKLGDQRYFRFLNEVYADLNYVITEAYGEIYQYVGDEIVITWRKKKGIKNARCLKCFFDVQEILDRLSDTYKEAYGHKPEFKAALHCGTVTTGEVGTIKKDIIYTGDVLNTTSRMLDQCNSLGVKLVVSSLLMELIELPEKYSARKIGEYGFRGKMHKVSLCTVYLKGDLDAEAVTAAQTAIYQSSKNQ